MDDLCAAALLDSPNCQPPVFGVIRVIENQITILRPYNTRYTGVPRSIFRKRYMEMITRVSLDLVSPGLTSVG